MLVHRGFNNGLSHRKDRARQLALSNKTGHPAVVHCLGPYLLVSQFKSFSIHLHSVGNNTVASSY